MDVGLLLLCVGAVLGGSVLVALGAARVGVPVLVVFLGLGMLLGTDGPGGIDFSDAELARTVGMVGLALILYEGGLSTSWVQLRSVIRAAASLSVVGVVATALLVAPAAYLLFHLTWLQSVLLGAVVSSTDAAAVFATLRNTAIRRELAVTLEAESGLNDPVAIALTLGLISWIKDPRGGFFDLLTEVVRQLGVGLVVGLILAVFATRIFSRLPTPVGPFAAVASLATAALSFGLAEVVGGSGFVAVYLVGIAIGSTPSAYRNQLVVFHQGLAYLAQVTLFVVLGLLVFPHKLISVAGSGLALTALLVFVVRPVAVLIATALSAFGFRERLVLGWAGLRGAAPIVLATLALSSGITKAETLFNVVFFVVVVSTLLQGTTLQPLAGRLHVLEQVAAATRAPLKVDPIGPLQLAHFDVDSDDRIAGTTVSELGLPHDVLVAAIARGGDTVAPRGSTLIRPGDRLYILNSRSRNSDIEGILKSWRAPP
jgi:cell volume regulation protein A